MKRSLLTILASMFAFAPIPVHAAAVSYFGGFEDASKANGSDFDYNDIVFSLSGTGLTLNTAGTWQAATPALGTGGAPFWNNSSMDGPNYNIGYCIYGGTPGNLSNCATNVYGSDTVPAGGLSPSDSYLTGSSPLATANDVTFAATGPVTLTIYAQIGRDADQIGYYLLSNPGTITYLSSGTVFTPAGAFGLVGTDNSVATYHSQTVLGDSTDTVSHFAFFGPGAVGGSVDPAVPEPSTAAIAGGMLALLFAAKRRT